MKSAAGRIRIQQGQPQEADHHEPGQPDPAQLSETEHDASGSGSGEPENIQVDRDILPRLSGWLGVLAANHGDYF
jgi:hypothetical protein